MVLPQGYSLFIITTTVLRCVILTLISQADIESNLFADAGDGIFRNPGVLVTDSSCTSRGRLIDIKYNGAGSSGIQEPIRAFLLLFGRICLKQKGYPVR